MTNFKNLVATIAAMALVAISNCAFAQDDLDALLNALESGGKKPAAKAETPPAAEAPVAETPAVAAAPSAAPAAPAAEAPAPAAEAPAAEAPAPAAPAAEAPAAEAPAVAEAPAAAPAASKKEVDDVLNLLNELSAETPAQAPAPAPAPAEAPAAVAEAPAPAAEAPAVAAAPSAAPAASAAETPAPAPAPALANPADVELLANIRATEKLRRESLDAQAKREIEEARECMGNSEYTEAVKHYGLAAKLLNDRPSSKKLRKECEQGIAEGLYRAALQEDSLGRRERAEKLMEKALDMRHPKAKRTLDRWLAADAEESGKAEAADLKHRRSEDDYKESAEQIRRHLRRSRQYLSVRDMDKALEEVEVVLVNDPYNQEAIRLRNSIQRKRQTILRQERVASRDGMIADVDEAWRPVYAVNAAQLNSTASSTVKAKLGDDPERAQEQEILRRMHEMRLPAIAFKPPATIMDAVEFFRQASKDYDRPDIPVDSRGFNFVLKTPQPLKAAAATEEQDSDGFGAEAASDASAAGNGLSQIPAINASNIPFDEALKLVCDQVDYKFIVRGSVVMVMHKDMSTAELISRKYDVLEAFLERMTAASSDVKEMKSQGFGGGGNKKDDGDENQERDWKEFFSQMGVKWPEGSSIMYIKTLGKLYVRNTLENLAEFEKVLVELGSQPKLIEIETRFVEVSQDDLNSLGFEWILNSDYSLNVGSGLSRALGLNSGAFGTLVDTAEGSSSWYDNQTRRSKAVDAGDTTVGGTWRRVDRIKIGEDKTIPDAPKAITKQNSKNIGINAFGGTSEQQNGNRYLSTVGNHISGESKSNNDQFMRINAFLGEADLSMILHMLAQRSDTDLLSAPKIVTKSGEEATIKVVTEYIYPQDYDVQLQSSSSSGSSSGGSGSSSAILAVVEPQNFTMREVGVILTVVPTYSEANGGTIDLELKPEVVDEPTWHNYGMRIPFTGNPSTMTTPSLEWLTSIGSEAVAAMNRAVTTLIGANASDIAKSYVDSGIASMNPSTLTYYDAPMEQPFFHTRKIDSKVSITPGSTVVMGGLITEARKAMDDKIPFLGDLPFIGRLFRSHSERTTKRNLLIFVTGRLITPSGRELKVGAEEEAEAEVKSAPQAE